MQPDDTAWVSQFIADRWGAAIVVAHGTVYRPAELPGFVASLQGHMAGLLTYHLEADACEVVTIDSITSERGVGSALIEAVKRVVQQSGCGRLWLITTNDNLDALRFYQKRGFALVVVHRNAMEVSRKLKPQIPRVGMHGIPLRDEIELEMWIGKSTDSKLAD